MKSNRTFEVKSDKSTIKKLGVFFENQVCGWDNRILHQTTHHVFTCANHVFVFVNIMARGYSHIRVMAFFSCLNMLD